MEKRKVAKAALIHQINNLINESPLDFKGMNIDFARFYLDMDEAHNIIPIIGDPKNKTRVRLIVRTILKGKYDDDLYRNEDLPVTAMKFRTPNSRVYCQESAQKTHKKIVMSRCLHNKGTQKNDKKIKDIISAIKNIEYKYYENLEEYKRSNN